MIRYIIGDIKAIAVLLHLISGKLRTPNNLTLNDLIQFFKQKYCLNIPWRRKDISSIASNRWFAAFTEGNGAKGVEIAEAKAKSDHRKRYFTRNISVKFRLDQCTYDNPNKASISPLLQKIAGFFIQCS